MSMAVAGAIAVRGPDHVDSDESTTGTISIVDVDVDETLQLESRNVKVTNAKTPPLKKWYEKNAKQGDEKFSHASISWIDKFHPSNLLSNHRRLILLIFSLVAIVVIVVSITVAQSSSNELSVQRKALMSLYERTNGPNWKNDANWGLPNVNECDWHGVTCLNGKVTKLVKYDDNLKGTIPTDVGLLTELTGIDLSDNNLSGQIPSALGSLTKLTKLHLHRNELTGTIPTEMGWLTNMEDMAFSTNQLIGTLPSEIASMTKLVYLYAHNTSLVSIPTEVCDIDIHYFLGDCPPCSLGCCTNCRFE